MVGRTQPKATPVVKVPAVQPSYVIHKRDETIAALEVLGPDPFANFNMLDIWPDASNQCKRARAGRKNTGITLTDGALRTFTKLRYPLAGRFVASDLRTVDEANESEGAAIRSICDHERLGLSVYPGAVEFGPPRGASPRVLTRRRVQGKNIGVTSPSTDDYGFLQCVKPAVDSTQVSRPYLFSGCTIYGEKGRVLVQVEDELIGSGEPSPRVLDGSSPSLPSGRCA